jgi:hypothetical protein
MPILQLRSYGHKCPLGSYGEQGSYNKEGVRADEIEEVEEGS